MLFVVVVVVVDVLEAVATTAADGVVVAFRLLLMLEFIIG